jgi:predicted metal-dependent hydrolase
VSSKQEWLIRTSRYYEKMRQQCGGFQPGTLFYKGVRFCTAIVGDRRFSVTVSDSLKTITFHVPDRRKVKRYQQEWYRQETGIMIAKRLPEIAECMQLHYNRVSVKKQKSRWGSCSRKGNLNFNLLLAAAPPAVVDYVIVHELAHLRVLNHSPQFWAHVQSVDPEYKSHREWLSTFAPLIRMD